MWDHPFFCGEDLELQDAIWGFNKILLPRCPDQLPLFKFKSPHSKPHYPPVIPPPGAETIRRILFGTNGRATGDVPFSCPSLTSRFQGQEVQIQLLASSNPRQLQPWVFYTLSFLFTRIPVGTPGVGVFPFGASNGGRLLDPPPGSPSEFISIFLLEECTL